jgi:hypothetical protein
MRQIKMKRVRNNTDVIAFMEANGKSGSKFVIDKIKSGSGEVDYTYNNVWIGAHRGIFEIYQDNEEWAKIQFIIALLGGENVARVNGMKANSIPPAEGPSKFRGYQTWPQFKIGNKVIPTIIKTTTLPLSADGLLKHKGVDEDCPSFIDTWSKHNPNNLSADEPVNKTFSSINSCVMENLCLFYFTGNVFLIFALYRFKKWVNTGDQMSNISRIDDVIVFELFDWEPERIAHLIECFQKFDIKLKIIIKKP